MEYSADFVKRLIDREHNAFMELFYSRYSFLRSVAFQYVLDEDTADDMVQETFLSIYENSAKLHDVKNLNGYLRVAVRHRCLNHLRSLNIADRNKLLFKKEQDIDVFQSHTEESSEIYAALMVEISQILDALPGACRNICKMRFVEGMKISEIAEKLSVTPGTVTTHLRRGLDKIRLGLLEKGLMDSDTTRIFIGLVLLSCY